MKKNAIVTGSSKGIGREIALTLAREGYNIIATYKNGLEDIKTLKNKIEAIGVKFDYYNLDLTSETSIINFYNNIKSKYEKIDILVNNASASLDSPFKEKTKEEFIEVLEVNLVGPFLLIQKLSDMLDGGIIINISSTDGINTYSKLNMDYSAAKAGLINLTKSLSLELENTKVYALALNFVDTTSTRSMYSEYLKSEMERIGQKNLISEKDVSQAILDIIDDNLKSGTVVVMEDKND